MSNVQDTVSMVRTLIGRDPGKLGATERENLTEGVHRLCAIALSTERGRISDVMPASEWDGLGRCCECGEVHHPDTPCARDA